MHIEKEQYKALVVGNQLFTRFCGKKHFARVNNGIVRCLEPSKMVIVEINFTLVLGNLSCTLPWGHKMTSLLKGLASRGGKIIISATSDLTVFADAESKIQISWNKSQNRPRHLSLFQIEQSNGVKFSVPVFSIVVNKRLRAIARGLEKGKGNPLIDFFANQNHLEAEAVLPYRGADEERTRISTILEPAKPTVMSNNISFMVMAKHISCVPSNSILNAYRTNDPCLLFWELSGVAHKNPLVPFRIIGKSSTPVT